MGAVTDLELQLIDDLAHKHTEQAVKKALDCVGKYSWAGSDQRAAAIQGYLTHHAVLTAALLGSAPG